MRKFIVASIVVLAPALLSGCSGATPATPTTFATTASLASLGVIPAPLFSQHVVGFVCPGVPPFSVPFQLLVQENRGVAVFVTEIRLQFVDALGAQMPQVTLPAPVMTREFGTLLVEARGSRTFPLSFALGCDTTTIGTVFIAVDMRDDRGQMQTVTTTAALR